MRLFSPPLYLVAMLALIGVALPALAEEDETPIPPAPSPVVQPPVAPEPDPMGELIKRALEATDVPDAAIGAGPAKPAQTAAERPSPPPIESVWERIRRGFAMPELNTRFAAQSTQWYAGQPDYIARMTGRASLYLFHIVEELEKRNMPMELALLPFVESAMQPEAVSHAKAAGLWQFIPSTGKLYDLEQNLWHDERRDVIESTRAALDYLTKLYNEFGHWHLALAAYNCGEGCVARAIARARAQRKPTDYASLRLPRESQHYVPKLQAIKNIVREPERHGLLLPAIRNEPYFVALTKSRDIDVVTAARLAEMPVDEFRALNPSFNRPLIIGAAQSRILLPAARADTYRANLAAFEATGQPLASWTTYTLRDKETLAQVAARAGVDEDKLREANRIPPRWRLAPRSTILIPRDETMEDDIAADKLAAVISIVPEHQNLRAITYRVRRGETLYSVARRWNVKPQEIIAWNNLRSEQLFAGQRLSLTVARAPARPVRKVAAARSGTKAAAAEQRRGSSRGAVVGASRRASTRY